MTATSNTQSTSGSRPPRKARKKFWNVKRALLLFFLVLVAAGLAIAFTPAQRQISAKGHISTDNEVELRPSIQGVIRQWLVRSGDRVEKDQVVIQLDDSIEQGILEQARTREQILEARLELRNEAIALEEELRKAKIGRAQQVLRAAQQELERMTDTQSTAFSPKEVEAAKLRVQLAQSDLNELEIERASVARKEIAVLEKEIQAVRQEIQVQKDRVELKKVRSAVAGTVQFNSYEPGEVVKPEHVLGQVFDERRWIVKLRISERAIAHIEGGQKVEVSLAGYPTLKYGTIPARITRITHVVTPQPTGDGVFYAEAEIEDAAGRKLSPGMAAVASVQAGQTTLLGSWLGW
jgi:multidrug resistance efflux pump